MTTREVGSIEQLRRQIDQADDRLLEALRDRLQLAEDINVLKHQRGRAPLDEKRWAAVLAKRTKMAARLGLELDLVQDIYNKIHDFVLRHTAENTYGPKEPLYSSPNAIFYLGPQGSYSHLVAKKVSLPKQQLVACDNISQLFARLDANKGATAVVAVENSITSAVHENIDAIFSGQYQIVGESYLNITLNLIGLEGASLKDVRTVYSHPKALAQCHKILKEINADTKEASSTSAAAQVVLAMQDIKIVCIGPASLAAKGLKVLKANIGDIKNNQTRFLTLKVASKRSNPKSITSTKKITVLADTQHKVGSLDRLLSALATANANLTKIESRPVPDLPWSYRFWLDIDISDADYRQVINAIDKNSINAKVIGAYDPGNKYNS